MLAISARHVGVASGMMLGDFVLIAIADPHRAVAYGFARLQTNPDLSARLTVARVVYDVATGSAEKVIESVRLGTQRSKAPTLPISIHQADAARFRRLHHTTRYTTLPPGSRGA